MPCNYFWRLLHFTTAPSNYVILYVQDGPVDSGLRQLLAVAAESDRSLICARTLSEAVDTLHRQHVDAVVLALPVVEGDAIERVQTIRSHAANTPIIVLGEAANSRIRRACVAAGAKECLSPREAVKPVLWRLVDRAVARLNEPPRPRRVLEPRPRPVGADGQETPPYEQLSRREREVFRLIALGRSVREVAETLRLSSKTVATYLHRIALKTGLTNRVEIARFAVQRGLVD